MKVLLVEDGKYKSDRVVNFLSQNYNFLDVDTSASYSSALKSLKSKSYDLAILDMSLPTFDNVESQNGGEFRTYVGLDLARQIKRKNVPIKFILLTQYKSLINNPKSDGLSDINSLAEGKYGDSYLGYIFYEHESNKWKEELGKVIEKF